MQRHQRGLANRQKGAPSPGMTPQLQCTLCTRIAQPQGAAGAWRSCGPRPALSQLRPSSNVNKQQAGAKKVGP